MTTNKPQSLCWKCAKACGGCSWSDRSFTPVDGWVAEPTKVRGHQADGQVMDSYMVHECPLFESDRDQYRIPRGEERWN